jgi:hypothetical protein
VGCERDGVGSGSFPMAGFGGKDVNLHSLLTGKGKIVPVL